MANLLLLREIPAPVHVGFLSETVTNPSGFVMASDEPASTTHLRTALRTGCAAMAGHLRYDPKSRNGVYLAYW
jgi:hypothetical protein